MSTIPSNVASNQAQAAIPPEVRGLNWGAFLLNWIWGIGNNVLIALLCLVPCVGFVMPFVLLFKGNEWAWRSKRWDSVEHFKRVQRIWAIVGVAVCAAAIVFAAVIMIVVMTVMKSTDVYQGAFTMAKADKQAIQVLGEPIEDGFFVSGSIDVSDGSGSAAFSFPVKGPLGSGKVYVKATKDMGKWNFEGVMLEVKSPVERSISLSP
jgi:hypothetical protein